MYGIPKVFTEMLNEAIEGGFQKKSQNSFVSQSEFEKNNIL
jgi:hypothetical protein